MGSPAQGGQPSLWDLIVPFLVVVAIMWLLVILPQRREQKRRDLMLKALKKGDQVITSSGIIGKVVRLKNDQVELKIDESTNTKIMILRSAIISVIEEKEDKEEDKKS